MVVIRERLSKYDDYREDAVDGNGDVVSVDPGDDIEVASNADDEMLDEASIESFISIDRGVSMTLGERALILIELAQFYSRQAQARGVQKARHSTRHRDGLVARYGSQTDAIVNGMVDRAQRRESKEDVLLGRLMMKGELVQAGFKPNHIDKDAKTIRAEIRDAIGVDAGKTKRNAVVKKIYNPE